MRHGLLHPFRPDGRQGAGEPARGLDDLGREDPFRAPLDAGARKQVQAQVPRTAVFRALLVPRHMPRQAGDQGPVNGVVLRRHRVEGQPHVRQQLADLAMDVLPLAHAHPRQPVCLAPLA